MSSYYEKTLATGAVRCIDEEIPFEIPDGWEWCKIKHICSMQAGKNISASEIYQDFDIKHPYRCVGGNGLRGYVSSFNTSGAHAIVGRQGALCGCLNIEEGDFYATEHAVVVDSYNIISAKFLYYFLEALNLNQYATATAQPGLAVSNVLSVFFPVPPLEEQKRLICALEKIMLLVDIYVSQEVQLSLLNANISDILKSSILQEAIKGRLCPQLEAEGTAEELLAEIRTEKQRLVKTGTLKKSVLASESRIFRADDNKYFETLGQDVSEITNELPFEIPEQWSWVRLGDLFAHNTGKALKGNGSGSNLLDYLTTSNLYWDYFDFSNVKSMYFSDNELEKCTVRKGDLLVCEGGDIGRSAIWNYDYEICIQNHIHKLRPYSANIQCRFFYFVLRYYKAVGLIGGKGIGIQGLSTKALHNIIVPLPPADEQTRIVERLDNVLANIMSR